MKNKTANRIVIGLEVDGKMHQVPLSEEKRQIVMGFLHALFDGPIKVVDKEMPIKILEDDEDTDQ